MSRVRRGNVSGPAYVWLLQDVTDIVAHIVFNVVPILWPLTYRAISRLDTALVAHHVWKVDGAPQP